MAKRGRNLAALAGLAGLTAAALRGRGTDLGLSEEDKEDVEEMRRRGPEYSTAALRGMAAFPSELRAGRRRVFETEPGMRNVMRTADDYPVTTEEGSFIRSGEYKKGGKTKSYAKGGVTRADGCVTKGHTKGKMR